MADLLPELDEALKTARLLPQDAAAVALARTYAEMIDDIGVEAVPDIGPKLLATLTALGMTPLGRGVKAPKGGEPDAGKPANPLDQLRARRAARNTA